MKDLKTTLCLLTCFSFFTYSCDIDKTEEGEAPKLDVDFSPGEAPKYDIDWAEVNVKKTTKTVEVPEVRVVMVEKEVEVPYLDFEMPDDSSSTGEKEEMTIMVEAEVSGETHQLNIQEIYATGEQLIVISELQSTGQDLQDETVRVSDQVVINAPDMSVKHYIVGDRPNGGFNSQYTYIQNKNQISNKLKNAQKIYGS